MSKSMLLITSTWGKSKTFRLIPATTESPYNEAIFDLDNKVLALISKDKKQTMHMLPKLNEFGDVQYLKIGKRANGKEFSEERKLVETFYEYYIENVDEVVDFVKAFAVNADTFNYQQYIDAKPENADQPSIASSLVI
jgi:hypothetical protein